MTPCNLVSSPWISVTGMDGDQRVVSLETLFANAGTLRGLALPPAERIAVLRLLLCIAQAALEEELADDEMEDPETELASLLEPRASDYLSRWRTAFDLFGEGPRFLQARTAKAETTPASKLFFPLASGNNPTLFDHEGGSERAFPPERLALGLLTYQNFSPLIGRGYFGRGPAVAGNALHVFRWGATLKEWILCNLIPAEHARRLCPEHGMGRPVWEMPPSIIGPAADKDDPAVINATATMLGRLTPLTRALWLTDDRASVVLDNGLNYPDYPVCREPSTAGRLIKKGKTGQEEHRLLGARLDRAIWRDLDAVLCLDTIDKQSLGMPATLLEASRQKKDIPIWTGAVVTDFKAKVEDTIEAVFIHDLALPHRLLEPETAAHAATDYQNAMKAASVWEEHLVKAVYAYGTEMKLDPGRRGTLRDSAVGLYWNQLGTHLPELFALLRDVEPARGISLSNPWAPTPWHRAQAAAAGQAFRSACSADNPRSLLSWGNGLRLLHPPNPDKPSGRKPPRAGKTTLPV